MPAAKQVSAFPDVFDALKKLLRPYEKNLKVMEDTPVHYTLGGTLVYNGKSRESMLMAVYSMKNYVSLHLVPIYICPEAAQGISAELKKRKQGKGCFNFDSVDAKLFKEVEGVVKKAVVACKAKKVI
ncbi:MAG TPA: hypothetical protein VGL89_16255 [Candidatus Koribacter sp.]|jgi:hypothetical protein